MDYRSLGTLAASFGSGLGCNNFGMRIDLEKTAGGHRRAIDSGINFLDTARMYGGGKSDRLMARRSGQARSGDPRDQSSAGRPNQRRHGLARPLIRSIGPACERARHRLRRPVATALPRPQYTIDETLSALTDLVRQGKVRYIVCSNFTGYMVPMPWVAKTRGLEPFVSVQTSGRC